MLKLKSLDTIAISEFWVMIKNYFGKMYIKFKQEKSMDHYIRHSSTCRACSIIVQIMYICLYFPSFV